MYNLAWIGCEKAKTYLRLGLVLFSTSFIVLRLWCRFGWCFFLSELSLSDLSWWCPCRLRSTGAVAGYQLCLFWPFGPSRSVFEYLHKYTWQRLSDVTFISWSVPQLLYLKSKQLSFIILVVHRHRLHIRRPILQRWASGALVIMNIDPPPIRHRTNGAFWEAGLFATFDFVTDATFHRF